MSTVGQKPGSNRITAKTLSNTNGGKPTAPAPTNAWARPLQPKRSTAPPPGVDSPKMPIEKASPSSPESCDPSSLASKLLHRERLLHLSLTLVGQSVVLYQTNGAIIEGIFHTFTPFEILSPEQMNKYVLKEILVRKQPTKNDDVMKEGVTLIIPASNVSVLHAAGSTMENGNDNKNAMNNGLDENTNTYARLESDTTAAQAQEMSQNVAQRFATDSQISNSVVSRNQDLVAAGNAWTSDNISTSYNIGNSSKRNELICNGGSTRQISNSRAAALAGNSKSGFGINNQHGSTGSSAAQASMSGSIGQWDQFKANKKLFNVSATFDENLYTTQLDTSRFDAKKVAEAERIANEIETTVTQNIHLAEERGFKVETDFDEEDLYSGVLTKDGNQRHEVNIAKKVKEKNSTFNKQKSNNIDSSKSSTLAKSAFSKKRMNYAAAAKADTASSNYGKMAPPGFSGKSHTVESLSSASRTTNSEEELSIESTTTGVTPEKEIYEDDIMLQDKKSVTKDGNRFDATRSMQPDPTEEKVELNQRLKDSTEIKEAENRIKDVSSTLVASIGKEQVENEKAAEEKEKGKEKKDKKPIKLNANAKSFSFNPSAKSFTPSLSGGVGESNNPLSQQTPQHVTTTDPGMQIYGGGHPLQHPHYMQAGPMGQPAMVPIINPPYQNMRYPPSYGFESLSQIQQPITHLQAAPSIPSAPNSGNVPTTTTGVVSNADEDDSTRLTREGEDISQKQPVRQQQQSDPTSQPQGQTNHQQPQQQQHQIPIPYNVPPGSYFTGGIPGIPSRAGGGYAQFITGPQQIAGRPGGPPYGIYPMQPGAMPHNMQMRGHSGVPFYPGPNGPVPYSPGAHMGYPIMDEGGGTDFRNRGGRSSAPSSSNNGRGRGRQRGSINGRGRGRSNNNSNNHS